MVTELVKGKTLEDALRITNKTVAEALGGLPKQKMHCSVLGEEALDAAIYDYLEKNDLRPDLRELIEKARQERKPHVDDPHGTHD
jgi:nitrogen fixation NifU-like protein